MDLLERVIFFAIGGGVGFILGFVVARLKVVETKVNEVEKEVHERDRNEDGVMRNPLLLDLALLVVVVVTVFAAFSASKTNQELDDTVECLTQYNVGQAEALKSRDRAINEEANAEIGLWGLYGELYDKAKSNPEQIPRLQAELDAAISEYREDLIRTQNTREAYRYPDPQLVKECRGQ